MIASPQTIRVVREGVVSEATISWRLDEVDWRWVVELASESFDEVSAKADDAFEALCLVRERVEPLGWRIGVAGAQVDVWPSGMAREQGGGKRAYRMTRRGGESLVDTFEPVDPDSVVTVDVQRAAIDRIFEEIQRTSR